MVETAVMPKGFTVPRKSRESSHSENPNHMNEESPVSFLKKMSKLHKAKAKKDKSKDKSKEKSKEKSKKETSKKDESKSDAKIKKK